MNNTLQIELETSTGAGSEAKPIHGGESEDAEQGEQLTTPTWPSPSPSKIPRSKALTK
jgi:hypothetical protein